MKIESVSSYFQNNRKSVGAIVLGTNWGQQMFLGYAFFDPEIAGVKLGFYDQARALMIMHEAIHLAGKGDAVFGGSKAINKLAYRQMFSVYQEQSWGAGQLTPWAIRWVFLIVNVNFIFASPGEWTITNTGITEGFGRAFFVDNSSGWVWAGRNQLWHTEDGGSSWAELTTNLRKPQIEVSGSWFLNPNLGWAVGVESGRPRLWKTESGGASWNPVPGLPWRDGLIRGALLDVSFVDTRNGWAVGFDGAGAVIIGTNDGGVHWILQYRGQEITGQFSRVHFVDRSNGWTLSYDSIMETNDGGVHWRLRYFGNSRLNDFSFLNMDSILGWAAGGELMKYQNGVWSDTAFPALSGGYFDHIRVIPTGRIWVSGPRCDVATSADNGASWERLPCPIHDDSQTEVMIAELAETPAAVFFFASGGRIARMTLR